MRTTPNHRTPPRRFQFPEARPAVRLALVAGFLVLTFAGCGEILLSPRQQVVRDAHRAICEARNVKAMAPYVTERSRPMLELATSLAELGQAFSGGALADRIAVECQSARTEFLDEVQVSETRFIVRTRISGKAEITDTVVVQEGGQWRIALF